MNIAGTLSELNVDANIQLLAAQNWFLSKLLNVKNDKAKTFVPKRFCLKLYAWFGVVGKCSRCMIMALCTKLVLG